MNNIADNGSDTRMDSGLFSLPRSELGMSLPSVSDAVRIFIRVRPPLDGEVPAADELLVDDRVVQVSIPGVSPHQFKFHHIFGPASTEDDVFQRVSSLVDDFLSGYSATVFVYGQSGSGKTHTMGMNDNRISPGLTYNALSRIFQDREEHLAAATENTFAVSMGFLQVYNNDAFDLFNPATVLRVRENVGDPHGRGLAHPRPFSEQGSRAASQSQSHHGDVEASTPGGGGPSVLHTTPSAADVLAHGDARFYVDGLTEVPIDSVREALKLVTLGLRNRTTAPTLLNKHSSRSHTVLQLRVTKTSVAQDGGQTREAILSSKLFLCDLAGSERIKKSRSEGARLGEAKAINVSLSCLGNVINALGKRGGGERVSHIPYRGCTLTKILADCVGGHSKTVLIATITPDVRSLSETFSTLLFAERCAFVPVNARQNFRVLLTSTSRLPQNRFESEDNSGPLAHSFVATCLSASREDPSPADHFFVTEARNNPGDFQRLESGATLSDFGPKTGVLKRIPKADKRLLRDGLEASGLRVRPLYTQEDVLAVLKWSEAGAAEQQFAFASKLEVYDKERERLLAMLASVEEYVHAQLEGRTGDPAGDPAGEGWQAGPAGAPQARRASPALVQEYNSTVQLYTSVCDLLDRCSPEYAGVLKGASIIGDYNSYAARLRSGSGGASASASASTGGTKGSRQRPFRSFDDIFSARPEDLSCAGEPEPFRDYLERLAKFRSHLDFFEARLKAHIMCADPACRLCGKRQEFSELLIASVLNCDIQRCYASCDSAGPGPSEAEAGGGASKPALPSAGGQPTAEEKIILRQLANFARMQHNMLSHSAATAAAAPAASGALAARQEPLAGLRHLTTRKFCPAASYFVRDTDMAAFLVGIHRDLRAKMLLLGAFVQATARACAVLNAYADLGFTTLIEHNMTLLRCSAVFDQLQSERPAGDCAAGPVSTFHISMESEGTSTSDTSAVSAARGPRLHSHSHTHTRSGHGALLKTPLHERLFLSTRDRPGPEAPPAYSPDSSEDADQVADFLSFRRNNTIKSK